MSQTTFLELVEGVGVETSHVVDPDTGAEIENPRAGEPAPLRHIGFQVPMPTMLDNGEIGITTAPVAIEPAAAIDPDNLIASRIIPGTRIVETNAPAVVATLVDTGHYRVCDPPDSGSRTPSKVEAKRRAEALGLPTTGTKAELLDAIAGHEADATAKLDAAAAAAVDTTTPAADGTEVTQP